jgi:hypothetical protein
VKPHERLLVAILAVVIGTAAWWGYRQWDHYGFATWQSRLPARPAPGNGPPRRPPLTVAELRGFLEASLRAEVMADPFKRCLAFPDPPGSHWSHAAVEAYCRYRTQPVTGIAGITQGIRAGNASEVDRGMAKAMEAQRSNPVSRGLIDRTYYQDFDAFSPELRQTVDAWKRQSPKSAFAYAASGWIYVAAARNANDDDHASSRDNALALARADLAAAQQLDPKLTTTYIAMLRAADLDDDGRRAGIAERQGLEADPANFGIYGLLMDRAKHDVRAMQEIADEAREHADANPLLQLVLAEPAAEASGVCGCHGPVPADAFRDALDRIATRSTMHAAGEYAGQQHLRDISAIFLSEEARFDPQSIDVRYAQINALMALRERVALQEQAGRLARVDADLFIALSPKDPDMLAQVGQNYVSLLAWDSAWNIAEQLIRDMPDDPNGWILRAQIQFKQPRPGLHETSQYIVDHFSHDERAEYAVEQARSDLGQPPAPSPP